MDENARQTLEPETAPPETTAPPAEGGVYPSTLDAADLRIAGYVAIAMFAAGASAAPGHRAADPGDGRPRRRGADRRRVARLCAAHSPC